MSSAAENLGSIFSKLFQLGLVVLLVGLVILILVSKASQEGEDAGDKGNQAEAGRRLSEEEARKLVAQLRELYGVELDSNNSEAGFKSEGGSGIIPLKAEREEPKGEIPLDRLFELAKDMARNVDYLADRTTEVQQAMAWIHADRRLHYVILLRPYDQYAAGLMKRKGEDLFVSFLGEDGKRLLPSSAPEQVPTRKMRVAAMEGEASGWTFYGELPLEGRDGNEVRNPKVGWIFSERLHARLKHLQQPRPRESENAPATDPFGLNTEVEFGERPPVPGPEN